MMASCWWRLRQIGGPEAVEDSPVRHVELIDIAILFRSLSDVQFYEDALRQIRDSTIIWSAGMRFMRSRRFLTSLICCGRWRVRPMR